MVEYFELKQKSYNLGAIDYNSLIKNKFIELKNNKEGSYFLYRVGDAISSRNIHAAIYDSLRINTNQAKPLYHLAEINYKILGDYDGANTLYNQVLTMGYNNYYKKSIERIIDIMISKGDLEQALSFIEKNKKITQKNDTENVLRRSTFQYIQEIDSQNITFLTL